MRARAEAWSELDGRLSALVEASAEHGSLGVTDEAFVAYAAERIAEDVELGDALAGLHPSELRLACGCAAGSDEAVAAFREQLGGAAATAASRAVEGDLADEVVQETMAKLLVGTDVEPPAIVKYAGRGRLAKWVQTVAFRVARTRTRKRAEEPSDTIETLADRMMEVGDPELDALKRTYRAQFKAAFQGALAGLTARQRNLLRLELLDRASIHAIASIHGVHAATISRWRAATRAQLLKETQRTFEREQGVGREEFQSIMRLIQSQLDVSLPRLLEEDEDAK